MKRIIATTLIVIIFCIPFMRSQRIHLVEITWIIPNGAISMHTVEFQGQQFKIGDGSPHKAIYKLKGSCKSAAIWSLSDWGVRDQSLSVDGTSVGLEQLKITETRGKFRILGLGRQRATLIEILPSRTQSNPPRNQSESDPHD